MINFELKYDFFSVVFSTFLRMNISGNRIETFLNILMKIFRSKHTVYTIYKKILKSYCQTY